MSNTAKEAAKVTKTNKDGSVAIKGYNAVDPQGHLVLLAPDQDLPGADWRWATTTDIATAKKAEAERASKEKADAKTGGPIAK